MRAQSASAALAGSGLVSMKQVLEDFGKELVVAIPLPHIIQRTKEEVRLLELLQHGLTAGG